MKKKTKSFVEKVASNNKTKDSIDTEKIFLTNDQLMNQRIIDLEVKYAKLESKYKKQKKRVNDIYENIEEDIVLTEPTDKAVDPVADKEKEKPPSKVPAEIPQKLLLCELLDQNEYRIYFC